ncbi:MAG TPA: hypothetical protein VI854_08365, partial [Acidimicrobiia bacterium]|nr:hypothetical protein [Acidimicrobiia bacterium]
VHAHGRCGRDVADRILDELEAMAASGGALVDSQSPVVRDQARRRGYTGPLRGPLTMGRTSGAAAPGAPVDRAATVAAVGALMGRPLTEDLVARRRRFLSSVRVGYRGALSLTVGEPRLVVTVPDSSDLMIESVARAIDTVLAVRDRFGSHAGHLQVVSFDRASHRSGGARWAGQANQTVFSIHLNDNLALADGWVRLHREREATPGRPSSATVPHPFMRVDGVSAHEAWHQIEYKFRGRRADHATFRSELGAVLGVGTLEQAIQGRHRHAPEELRLACKHLVQTVSPYAAKNPVEATAEMFKLWWCGVSNPTIDCFGGLLERFFGVASP